MATTNSAKHRPLPEYDLTSYDPVEFVMPAFEVTPEIVEQRMQQILESVPADYEPSPRLHAGVGDILKIAVHVDKDGEDIKPLCQESRLYELEKGYMPNGFDAAIKGMKVNETLEFDFMAPDYDTPNSPESSYHAKVTLLDILQEKERELTDEWVKRYSPPCMTVQEFKEQTRIQLCMERDANLENERSVRAVNALSQRFDGKIDDYWYETTRADLMKNYEEQAQSQGMTMAQMLQAQGMGEQQFGMMLMMQVREMLVQGFSLDAWARHFKMVPTDADVLEVANIMSNGRGQEVMDQIKAEKDREKIEGMRIAARRYLANKNLVETAVIKQEQKAAEQAPQGELTEAAEPAAEAAAAEAPEEA